MAQEIPQTYATHRRFDPMYHFVAFGLVVLGFVVALVQLFRQPGLTSAWMLVISAALVLVFFKMRIYALHVQDRLIRLEESLRMERVLPQVLRPRIAELSPDQFVGLRFASDAELPGLVEQALAEKLDREAIKKRIQTWRPDSFRV